MTKWSKVGVGGVRHGGEGEGARVIQKECGGGGKTERGEKVQWEEKGYANGE